MYTFQFAAFVQSCVITHQRMIHIVLHRLVLTDPPIHSLVSVFPTHGIHLTSCEHGYHVGFLASQIPLFSWHAKPVAWLLPLSVLSSIPTFDEYRHVCASLICLTFADHSKLYQLEIWKLDLLLELYIL